MIKRHKKILENADMLCDLDDSMDSYSSAIPYISFKILCFLFIVFICIISFLLSSQESFAHPSLPTEIYGVIYSYNTPAPSGSVVTAYSGNISCGTFTIVNGGYYGVLSCIGDDSETSLKEGGVEGETLSFRYNSNPTTAFGDSFFSSGNFIEINITYPVLYCGDGFCDRLENCLTCEIDCYVCNATTNQTTNQTSNQSSNQSGNQSSGGSGSGGGSGGGGGGGSSSGSGTAGSTSGGTTDAGDSYTCFEAWDCTEWTECNILGIQSRNCTDSNGCGTYDSKPLEVQECIYEGTCFDGIINCHDGLCEEGIDCGGPCDKCPFVEKPWQNVSIKLPKLELPERVCERHIDWLDKGLWAFLIIILLSIIGRKIFADYRIQKIRLREDLTSLYRSKKVYEEKYKFRIFALTILFLSIASLAYSYYFILCPNIFFEYSWILVLLILLIPLVIHSIMKKFAYNEDVHFRKSRNLEDTHYQNILKMIQLGNELMAEEENLIANKLYEISMKEEFKKLSQDHKGMKTIYNDLVQLYSAYNEKKNPFALEQDLCGKINALSQDAGFIKDIKSYPEMEGIFSRLQKLYSQYEEKQKLYEELEKVVESQDQLKKKSEK